MIGVWVGRIEAVWQGAQRLFPANLKLLGYERLAIQLH